MIIRKSVGVCLFCVGIFLLLLQIFGGMILTGIGTFCFPVILVAGIVLIIR